jgi:hypothetical protein
MFRTVVLDPPWQERGGGKIKRGADRHYPLVKTEDMTGIIAECPHWSEVQPDAHMYIWVTNNFLKDGLWLMGQLGFTYKTNVVWVKQRIGLGQYFRGKHELCLFGVRGDAYSVRTDDKTIASVITADRGLHSKKPDAFMELVEKRSKGPYLELFARRERENWTCWGNEV